jgi:hypothetical protein
MIGTSERWARILHGDRGVYYGPGLEMIAGFTTTPGVTFTPLTMSGGTNRTVRNTDLTKQIRLLNTWTDSQVAGTWRIKSPKLHDNVQGIRLDTVVGNTMYMLPLNAWQRLYPQDELTLEITGSAVAGDIESAALLIWYEDLPGANARLIGLEELARRSVNIFTTENTIATGTAGGFSGQEPITAEFDLWKANTDYALLGYLVDTECAAVRWIGADIANLGIGGPGQPSARQVTSEWFVRLTRQYAMPFIPVFNSANKDGILVDAMQDENGADVTLTSIFAELSPGAGR